MTDNVVNLVTEDAWRIGSFLDLSSLQGKSVLVTGGTGLIGTMLVKTLRSAGISTGVICTRTPPQWWIDINGGGFFIMALGEDQRELPRYDVIIHAAGFATPGKFIHLPLQTLAVNTAAIPYLLRHMKTDGLFMYLSSAEVYDGGHFPDEFAGLCTPVMSNYRACYVYSKLAGEAFLNTVARNQIVRIARVSSVYGPGFRLGDDRVMPTFIESALRDGEVVVKGNGISSRSFCYVADAVRQLLSILLHGEDITYNVGNSGSCTINQLAGVIGLQTGATVSNEPATNLGRSAVTVSTKKIEAEFPHLNSEVVPLGVGVQRTIDWFKFLLSLYRMAR